MYRLFFVLLLQLGSLAGHAQIYVDPAVAAATAAHSGLINSQLRRNNEHLSLIQRGQLAVTGELALVNNLQGQIYRGLSEVSSALRSVVAVTDIAQTAVDIFSQGQKAVDIAKSNPLLLLFAEQGIREFRTRAIALSAEVSSFVLQGGSGNLMDSGERAKLLGRIREQLLILRGIAFGMQRTMFWASQRGILNSLNPYAGFVNMDKRIADEILFNSKLIKP